jgi:hypothetical protein
VLAAQAHREREDLLASGRDRPDLNAAAIGPVHHQADHGRRGDPDAISPAAACGLGGWTVTV